MTNLKWMKSLAAVMAIGLLMASCSSDDSNSDGAGDQNVQTQDGAGGNSGSDDGATDDTVTMSDDGGEVVIGGGELPDDMPFDVPDGGQVQAVATSSEGNVVSLIYPASAYDGLVDHFAGIYEGSAGNNKFQNKIEDPPAMSWAWETESGGIVSITVQVQSDQALASIIYDS